MMLCLGIVMITTMNGFIENTKFEYVDGASRMIFFSDKFDDNCQEFAKEDVTLSSTFKNAIE